MDERVNETTFRKFPERQGSGLSDYWACAATLLKAFASGNAMGAAAARGIPADKRTGSRR
jgi:hypothetical protein